MSNLRVIDNKGGGGFAMAPQNLDQALQLAEMLSSSGMVPKAYINKPQDTLVAMMMGSEIGLNPIQSLQNIATINGKPSIYGDAIPALMMRHPLYDGMKEDFDDATMTATCTVRRRGSPEHTVKFSRADAEKAALWGKTGPWSQYPKRMLQMRARAYAARDQFADALGGLSIAEDIQDTPNPSHESKPLEHRATIAQEKPPYNDAQMVATRKKVKQKVESGELSAKDVINTILSSSTLTAEQESEIKGWEAPVVDQAQGSQEDAQ